MANLAKQTVTSLKYRDLINKSDSTLKVEALDLKEAKAKAQLQVTIATSKLKLAESEEALTKAMCADPYSLDAEIQAYNDVESIKAGLEYAERVLAERF
jgi:hypothetical protein